MGLHKRKNVLFGSSEGSRVVESADLTRPTRSGLLFPVVRGPVRKVCFSLSITMMGVLFMALAVVASAQDGPWKIVDTGLFWAEFDSPLPSITRDLKIVAVKIDPRHYAFRLLCASELGGIRLTTREWCKRYNLVSAVNAGMYQKDGFTNVGFMKNFSHLNNPRLNSTYKAVLAFNRVDLTVPEIQIIDLKCQDFEELKPKYHTFVQNIRMISCKQENVWSKQDNRWSLAVWGVDKSGHTMIVFSEAPYSGHDFNNILLSLPLFTFNAMYLEGGPEANLFLSHKGVELDRVGIHETTLNEGGVRVGARVIPNVIGVVKK
jgi:Phosphodiester glycosidase